MEVVNTRPAASSELRGLRGGDLCTFPDLNSPTAAIFSHYTGPAGPAPGTAAPTSIPLFLHDSAKLCGYYQPTESGGPGRANDNLMMLDGTKRVCSRAGLLLKVSVTESGVLYLGVIVR